MVQNHVWFNDRVKFPIFRNMIRLLIADDHQDLLDGFISIFDDIDDISVVGTAYHGKEVLDFLSENVADVILLDINMPVLNGVETCKKVTKHYPHIKVVALSMYDQQSYFKRMIQHGAKGYLLKNDSTDEIEKAIRKVHEGGRYVSSQMQSMTSSIDYIAGEKVSLMGAEITSQELEVLQLISERKTDLQIEGMLLISINRIKSYRKNLLLKFDAKTENELIKKAMKNGIL